MLMHDVIGAVKAWKRLTPPPPAADKTRPAYRRMKAPAAALVVARSAWRAVACRPPAAAPDLKRGEALLTRACGSCHAVGRGDSADKDAPAVPHPRPALSGRRSLEEALGEGFMSGHPDMPEFQFDADDVGAIIAYLKSIQQR